MRIKLTTKTNKNNYNIKIKFSKNSLYFRKIFFVLINSKNAWIDVWRVGKKTFMQKDSHRLNAMILSKTIVLTSLSSSSKVNSFFLTCFSWLRKLNSAAFFWSLANLFSYFDTFFRVGFMLKKIRKCYTIKHILNILNISIIISVI